MNTWDSIQNDKIHLDLEEKQLLIGLRDLRLTPACE